MLGKWRWECGDEDCAASLHEAWDRVAEGVLEDVDDEELVEEGEEGGEEEWTARKGLRVGREVGACSERESDSSLADGDFQRVV